MITAKIKNARFDGEVVMSAKERAHKRVTMKQAAYVRTAARRSMRTAPDVRARRRQAGGANVRAASLRVRRSRPGQPPFNRTGKLKNAIRFAYDRSARGAIVGPLGLSGSTGAALLEYGGTDVMIERRNGRRRKRRVTIKARPYMSSTIERTADKLAKMWRDQIR